MVPGKFRHNTNVLRILPACLVGVRRARPPKYLEFHLRRLATFAIFLAFVSAQSSSLALEIDFPEIDATYAIHVTADTVAEEKRGAYQVLAFRGDCELKQGTFTAKAHDIVLWIERVQDRDFDHPGKTICYFSGDVVAGWGGDRQLKDEQWMVRLFSVHPIMHVAQPIKRYDIPALDWKRELSAVQPAQFMQTEGRSGAVLTAPPLLDPQFSQDSTPVSPGPVNGPAVSAAPAIPGAREWTPDASNRSEERRSTGVEIQPLAESPISNLTEGSSAGSSGPSSMAATAQLPSPSPPAGVQANESPAINSSTSPVPISPAPSSDVAGSGTQQFESGQNATNHSNLFPSGGLVVPSDGSPPYPASGLPPSSEEIAAPQAMPSLAAQGGAQNSLPTDPQVVRQVPTSPPFSAKSVQFLPRSSVSPAIRSSTDPTTGEMIVQITGGFKMVAQGIQATDATGAVEDYGTVSLEADNAVVWLHGESGSNWMDNLTSTPERPIELYLDGNIVFFQGNRVIYADRMYYNVSSEYGMVLSAEVLTPVPQYQGLLRLKADVLQQRDSRNFKAFGAAVTSSRLGVPRYWLQSGEVEFQDYRDESDLTVFATTDANRPTDMRATGTNNLVYLGGFPIFYWPTFSTNLKQPSFYLTGLSFKNDDIFGFQTYSKIDVFNLLGIDPPEGSDFEFSLDYLSERGPAIGTDFNYQAPTWLFGIPGVGYSNSWFIWENGLDVLGWDRTNLVPEEEFRGRSLSRHRLFPSPNWELMLETGYISDRDFLEQYFEQEWETEKDFDTELRVRRYNGNRTFEVFARPRINRFFTETEWLPRIDHNWLGQDLLGQRFTWSASTNVAYAHQKVATTPTDPQNAAKFALLPWETDSEGLRAITRQELSLPLSMGSWRVIPFVSGEAGYWKEDVLQQEVNRFTGQAGVRTSLPMWRVYPNIENRLFDLRGIAHKVSFDTEFFYADSSEDLSRFPLYDRLDDNSQEHYRRRFIFNTFGGALPPQFDERGYAVRSGMQRWVTAGSKEIVEDLTQVRFGIDQRWQTKRGLPGRERVVDLVSFDVDFTLFPKAARDNFGEDVGAINYDFRYHVGDRLTLLSDGYFDVFSQGLNSITAGAQISRPGRGQAYVGFLSMTGPFSSNVINANVNYRLNEKWILNGFTLYDFAGTGSIGQALSLTRIGESALIQVGMDVNSGRDNVVFSFRIEPRFLPSLGLGIAGGELIPPAGLFGLE